MEEIKTTPIVEEQDLNEILRVRREKLDNLVKAGKNPFEKVRYDRTAYSQIIKDNYAEYEGKDVTEYFITRDSDGAFRLEGGMMEELARNVVIDSSDSFAYFQRKLKDEGVIKALKKHGIADGDTVRVLDIEFEFVE